MHIHTRMLDEGTGMAVKNSFFISGIEHFRTYVCAYSPSLISLMVFVDIKHDVYFYAPVKQLTSNANSPSM